ncbi:hypothetical protein [Caballeronia sp. AZ1_KS37]|uniref:hypothetical protein n=1 Tax=Caballeronia sp. AZ1_KS37 TaxID=2921756 RepID=UPI002027F1F8|nr:hypothetical protein [Caballeronia sp. AZ1_KS37]
MPSTTNPLAGIGLLDVIKNLYGLDLRTAQAQTGSGAPYGYGEAAPAAPSAPDSPYVNQAGPAGTNATPADLAYQQAAQASNGSLGDTLTSIGRAITKKVSPLLNLPDTLNDAAADASNNAAVGTGAPMGFGGQGGQASNVVPSNLLATIQTSSTPSSTPAPIAHGAPTAKATVTAQGATVAPVVPATPVTTDTPIALATGAPDVTLDANSNVIDPNVSAPTQNLSNTDRESNPFQNQLGLFNQQAADLAANPDPQAAKGLLGSLSDTLGDYSTKLKSLSPAASQGLIQAGLGILAGNDGRHSLGQVLGAAGASGMQTYSTAKQQALVNAQKVQQQATENAKFALDIQKAASEDAARKDNSDARRQEIAIQAQNATTAALKANAEMNGTMKWVTVQQPDGSYVQQGFDRSGKPTSVIPASADDVAKLTQTKAPTEGQSKAAGYANRLIQNESVIQSTYPSMQGVGGVWNNLAPNILKSTAYQQYEAAKGNWIAALLRQESGAAIGKEEYATADKQYFPQPGDSQAVIDQKAALRATATQSMIGAAGPNYKPTVTASQPTSSATQDYMAKKAVVIKAAQAGNPSAIAAARSAGWTF